VFADLVEIDGIRFPQKYRDGPFRGSTRQRIASPGPGNRMGRFDKVRNANPVPSERPHLILKPIRVALDQVSDPYAPATHQQFCDAILNSHRRPPSERYGLNKRPGKAYPCARTLRRRIYFWLPRFEKYRMNVPPMILRFPLWIKKRPPNKGARNSSPASHMDQINVVMVRGNSAVTRSLSPLRNHGRIDINAGH